MLCGGWILMTKTTKDKEVCLLLFDMLAFLKRSSFEGDRVNRQPPYISVMKGF